MTALQTSNLWISPEEYLEGELRSSVKHEYVDGHVFSMAGASRVHNLIAGNAFALFYNHLRGKRCTPFGSDMRVRLPSTVGNVYYYPDLSVTCDPEDNDPVNLERPVVLMEVLSKETAHIDTREKRLAYRSIATLDTYLLLEQDGVRATVLRRIESGWRETVLEKNDDLVEVAVIGFSAPLGAFYERTGMVDGWTQSQPLPAVS